jgi:hypothetical protein
MLQIKKICSLVASDSATTHTFVTVIQALCCIQKARTQLLLHDFSFFYYRISINMQNDDRLTFLLPRPVWVSDIDVSYCSSCNSAFGPLKRRVNLFNYRFITLSSSLSFNLIFFLY